MDWKRAAGWSAKRVIVGGILGIALVGGAATAAVDGITINGATGVQDASAQAQVTAATFSGVGLDCVGDKGPNSVSVSAKAHAVNGTIADGEKCTVDVTVTNTAAAGGPSIKLTSVTSDANAAAALRGWKVTGVPTSVQTIAPGASLPLEVVVAPTAGATSGVGSGTFVLHVNAEAATS